jgi:glycine cleavage system aminomethyltransferase T
MLRMSDFREQYEKAQQLGKLAFAERPYFGSPAAPAQAETNASQIWGHINSGYLIAYEYTRWWKESLALRNAAVLGDWSWLNKTRVTGRDAAAFMNYCAVKDLARQEVGQILYTPMCSAEGKVAIEGLTLKLAENEYLFTQSAGLKWLEFIRGKTGMKVDLHDVTPDYTCYALQGPRSTEVLEALTGESWRDLKFSRFRTTSMFDSQTLVARQGVTGEIGYEFLMRTDTGRAHELWRRLREVGRDFGLRELGFKAQMIGHTETGIATVIRDYLPARGTPEQLRRMMRHWMPADEHAAIDWDISEQLCHPAELGWGYTVSLDKAEFHGKSSLEKEIPKRKLVGLEWSSEDMATLHAAQYADGSSPPPPDLPTGHFQVLFLRIREGGWASGYAYSPTLRRMISLARLDRGIATGTKVQVAWGGIDIGATVVELPFIARKREKAL